MSLKSHSGEEGAKLRPELGAQATVCSKNRSPSPDGAPGAEGRPQAGIERGRGKEPSGDAQPCPPWAPDASMILIFLTKQWACCKPLLCACRQGSHPSALTLGAG